MPDYDFRTLSPSDFELLTRDLMRSHVDIDFEAFGHGPDGGVDLRSTCNGQLAVVQCKHYRGSTFHDLKRTLKSEKTKMDRLRPNLYFFVTSQDLSLTQKETVKRGLAPHISDTKQIIALRDLNKLLADQPDVEENHFKLWMASAGVLRRIVDSGLWERSTALMEEIHDRVRLYVSTESFPRAREMLDSKHVCVIAGAPGVGKSMLADMLALTHWEAGWQIISLASHEVDKSWDAWDSDRKQLYYFDDVFGQTDVQERLSNDGGVTVARLIARIGKTANKRLVITSRTHVLREAELRDEPVERAGLRARECVVQVTDYNRLHRARILYNHLYFSSLSRSCIQTLLRSETHWQIIDHRNFTPRLIEQTILQQEREGGSSSFSERVIAALEHPVLLWGSSFREALSEQARLILMHLTSFAVRGASLTELRATSMRTAGTTPLDYQRALKQLEGSWIRITRDNDLGMAASFHDPSCRDFVLAFLDSETEYFASVLTYCSDAAQLSQILAYARATTFDSTQKGGRKLKYPGMDAHVRKNTAPIAELAKAAWANGSTTQDLYSTETLGALAALNEHYKLGLDSWLVETTLSLGPTLERSPDVDSQATLTLVEAIMESDVSIDTPERFESCRQLFTCWCYAIVDGDDWRRLASFAEWVEAGDYHNPGRNLFEIEHDSFEQCFDEWIKNEFDALMENAAGPEEAEGWLDELVATTRRFDMNNDQRNEEFRSTLREHWEPWPEQFTWSDVDERTDRNAMAIQKATIAELALPLAPDGQAAVPIPPPTMPYGEEQAQVTATINAMFVQLEQAERSDD